MNRLLYVMQHITQSHNYKQDIEKPSTDMGGRKTFGSINHKRLKPGKIINMS